MMGARDLGSALRLVLTAGFVLLLTTQAPAQTWTPTGSMATPRREHTATLLPDGKVLVAGGTNLSLGSGSFLRSAELYDPDSGAWSVTSPMTTKRVGHTATLLLDGRVLIVGGAVVEDLQTPTASAELYDPASGMWVATGSMSTPRYFHTATRLLDGRVLLSGGAVGDLGAPKTATAELYDPATGLFTPTGSLNTPRVRGISTLLPDGTIMVASGETRFAETYDPAIGTWTPAGPMLAMPPGYPDRKVWFPAVGLPDGRVLISGGGEPIITGAEIYDPATRTFSPTGSLGTARAWHTATLLPDGRVLAAGGHNGLVVPLASAEVYDPASGTWTPAASMGTARSAHTATRLLDGCVLVVGGAKVYGLPDESGHLASAELYGGCPAGPITSDVTADPNPIMVGGAVVVSAVVDDTGRGDSAILSAEYTLDGGTFPLLASDGAFDEVREEVTSGVFAAPAAPGVYELCASGTGADGVAGSLECILLVVYDPEGGFVTGGGWIYSPAGALKADPVLEGRANFGFVSKYKKGATMPSGQTQFVFQMANLSFHSSSYEWLVVNQAGTNAQYKGAGTINWSGSYKFMLWAGDGAPDTFRIRIWWEDQFGVEYEVYDNGVAQPLSGGEIIIHKK